MTDAWNMTGGKVYVAPVGADPKDPSRWHQVGTLTEMEMRQDDGWYGGGRTTTLTTRGPLTLFKPEPVKTRPSVAFTFSLGGVDPELLKLYYGTDVKAAGVVNNRGEARKEEKHMGVRKFKSQYDKDIEVKDFGAGVQLDVKATHGALLKHADVPLIAHALFEKSGWPDAEQDDDGDYLATVGTKTAFGMGIRDQSDADVTLARAIANLAAYNAWHEGAAEREAAEAAKKAEAARKREHDELRTSAIALEALALYNEANGTQYGSWSDTAMGFGHADDRVLHYIAKAEAARAAKPAPKVGDRVRVSADAKTVGGGNVHFGGEEVEGVVVSRCGGDIDIKATTTRWPGGITQYVDPKYVTVVATAEDLAAEKAKAERDAGIAAITKADYCMTTSNAARLYDLGIRATA